MRALSCRLVHSAQCRRLPSPPPPHRSSCCTQTCQKGQRGSPEIWTAKQCTNRRKAGGREDEGAVVFCTPLKTPDGTEVSFRLAQLKKQQSSRSNRHQTVARPCCDHLPGCFAGWNLSCRRSVVPPATKPDFLPRCSLILGGP